MDVKHHVYLLSLSFFFLPAAQEYKGGSGAGRVLVCSWLLLNVVLAAFYSSKLTATLTVKSKEPPFTSLAQLVRQDTYTWGIASGTAKSSLLRVSYMHMVKAQPKAPLSELYVYG